VFKISCGFFLILKLSVQSGKHNTECPCLAHLQDVTSKTVPNITYSPTGLKTQISRRTWNELSFMLSFLLGHCPRSLCLVTFLPLCLHLHLSSHVYLCACNGSRLHSSRSFNSLLPCITLQPPLFQHPTSTLVRASLGLACIALKVLIVSCLALQLLMFQHPTSTFVRAWRGRSEEYCFIPSLAAIRKTCNNIL
jgi:hypothetical protein